MEHEEAEVDEGALSWQERALCAQTDPEAFFPEKGGSTREAKKVCLSCDVRSECLEYALGQRRAVRHLGRPVGARTAQAEEARGLALTGTSRRTSPAVCAVGGDRAGVRRNAALSASSHTVVDALRLSRGRTAAVRLSRGSSDTHGR